MGPRSTTGIHLPYGAGPAARPDDRSAEVDLACGGAMAQEQLDAGRTLLRSDGQGDRLSRERTTEARVGKGRTRSGNQEQFRPKLTTLGSFARQYGIPLGQSRAGAVRATSQGSPWPVICSYLSWTLEQAVAEASGSPSQSMASQ